MGKIRRKFEVEFKQQLISRIEAGELTMTQACQDYQLAHSVLERWRAQYRSQTLTQKPSNRERQLEAENRNLKAKVGELVMQMEHLKKREFRVFSGRSMNPLPSLPMIRWPSSPSMVRFAARGTRAIDRSGRPVSRIIYEGKGLWGKGTWEAESARPE